MESCVYDSITPARDELIMKKDYVVKLKVKEALENRERQIEFGSHER